jgi:hypothetical protein
MLAQHADPSGEMSIIKGLTLFCPYLSSSFPDSGCLFLACQVKQELRREAEML